MFYVFYHFPMAFSAQNDSIQLFLQVNCPSRHQIPASFELIRRRFLLGQGLPTWCAAPMSCQAFSGALKGQEQRSEVQGWHLRGRDPEFMQVFRLFM